LSTDAVRDVDVGGDKGTVEVLILKKENKEGNFQRKARGRKVLILSGASGVGEGKHGLSLKVGGGLKKGKKATECGLVVELVCFTILLRSLQRQQGVARSENPRKGCYAGKKKGKKRVRSRFAGCVCFAGGGPGLVFCNLTAWKRTLRVRRWGA